MTKASSRSQSIAIFGLGYVGCVSAACLSNEGHTIIGVDVQTEKVDLINRGISPIIEKDIDSLIRSNVENGRLSATSEAFEALKQSSLSIVCVGTPSNHNGSLNLQYIRNVTEIIAEFLHNHDEFHVVMYRSTMLPGSTQEMIELLESISGKKAGKDFGVSFNPEFLREGTAVADYREPPKIVYGCTDERTQQVISELYQSIDAPTHVVSLPEAELVKYVDNSFHALKVAFANEIGRIGNHIGVDSQKIMQIFASDTKLNISHRYFRPGGSYGGSCLPKDVRALTSFSSQFGNMPILNALESSNAEHLRHAEAAFLKAFPKRIKVGVVGISFKSGTDDLRESPTVQFVKFLLGEGYDVTVYDPLVHEAHLLGANKAYIQNALPQLSQILEADVHSFVASVECLVISDVSLINVEILSHLKTDIFNLNGADHAHFNPESRIISVIS